MVESNLLQHQPLFISVELREPGELIFPPQHLSRAKIIQLVDLHWQLTVPKEDTDPNDKLNYVKSYTSSYDKLTPTFLATRNPTEGFYQYNLKQIIVKSPGYGEYNQQGTQTDIIGKGIRDTTSLTDLTIKFNQEETDPYKFRVPGGIDRISLLPFIEWEYITIPDPFGYPVPATQILQTPLFQSLRVGNRGVDLPGDPNIDIQLPITHQWVNFGIGNQPNWNRTLYLRFKLTFI